MTKQVVIIGAGPAGLTAAYQLVTKTPMNPIVVEADGQVGGLSKTINYKNNRMDIGGHRFFSKSSQVVGFWQSILPYESADFTPDKQDTIMLLRSRLSRILFGGNFYAYPLALSFQTLANLGFVRTCRIGFSYLSAKIRPIVPEISLADFFINRFGQELYSTFFKDYTEKVWGVSCLHIPRDWGAQRIKGLSISQAILHALKKQCSGSQGHQVETSLIEQFHYPKFGPGQLWEEVAAKVSAAGGTIRLNSRVVGLSADEPTKITGIMVEDGAGQRTTFPVAALFSSMPIRDLVAMLPNVPPDIRQLADGLPYRDFITVGLLFDKHQVTPLPDNWIYVQEPHLKVGRIQVFNNWSPYLVNNPDQIWLGLEYFCQEGDELWTMPAEKLQQLALDELTTSGFIKENTCLDATVIKVPKAYPAYFGTYEHFERIKHYLSNFDNLYCIGRNGQHRYNNMDHSMLTAMLAVEFFSGERGDREAIWQVNTEEVYHEK
jgi:protoporphyrinogen oxidase